jgi:hypothetical protein
MAVYSYHVVSFVNSYCVCTSNKAEQFLLVNGVYSYSTSKISDYDDASTSFMTRDHNGTVCKENARPVIENVSTVLHIHTLYYHTRKQEKFETLHIHTRNCIATRQICLDHGMCVLS